MAGAVVPSLTGRGNRWWRRTRLGLLVSAIGLLTSWIPIVAVLGALLLSLGSTFLFLGARAGGRRHEQAVVVAFLVLTVGGVIIGVLVSAFLLQAHDAAERAAPLSALREPARLMLWASLPASVALAAGFALQVAFLLPRRQWRALLAASALLALTAFAATVLADPEVDALGFVPVRAAAVADFLIRVSLYRIIEAPAYVGLALAYFTAYWSTEPVPSAGPPSVPTPEPGKG